MPPNPSYATQALTTGNITVTVTATGTLNPVRSVSIGSELSGIVAKVNVDVNSTVKAGDVLIELDTAKLESAVNQARAALSSAKAQARGKPTPPSLKPKPRWRVLRN